MREGNKNRLIGLILSVTIFALVISSNAANKKSLSLSSDAKKLKQATQSLYDSKTRKQGIKDLWRLAKFANRKRIDSKFVIGCRSLGILARATRNAVGYEKEKHEFFLPTIKEFKDPDVSSIDKKEIAKIDKLLQPFDDYSVISNWNYQKQSSEKFSNPRLLPFIELAYLKTISKGKDGASFKNSLKMLNYAESHTEGLDKAGTLCQFGELLRELKEFRRSEKYLNNALEYGNQWFKGNKVSENSNESKVGPGIPEWQKLKARIERLLFLLSFDLLEIDYGESYAAYVKMRAFIAKEEWWLAFPLAVKLKDEYPDTVYGEYGRLAWCRMLLGNDKAEEMQDKSLPSGVNELEKFISEKPEYKLYHGEALMELGKFYLEYKCDSKQASKYYNLALEWFREVRKRKDLIDLYTVPAKVASISAPHGKLSNLNQWRQIEYRKADPKEIINSQTAPEWYVSENEKNCLFMVGFFYFVDGKYDEAKKYFEQVKDVDVNVAKLVCLDWPNIYWRLISACNVKRMIFPSDNKKYLRGKNKLRVALAELNYICEKFFKAKELFQEVFDDPKSANFEKAIALIGIGECTCFIEEGNAAMRKNIEFLQNAASMAKNSDIAATAWFLMGRTYLGVAWEDRNTKALENFEKYLKKCPNGVFAIEAKFQQIDLYLDLGKISKAKLLFTKYEYFVKHPNSGYTRALIERFK